MNTDGTVIVVDDNDAVRAGLSRLLESVGLAVQAHASAEEFLDAGRPVEAACLLLDIRMPGMCGLDLQETLTEAGQEAPIVFMTGHGSVSESVRAMRAGAVDFLEKPLEPSLLLEAVERALESDRTERESRDQEREIRSRSEELTPREREVFALVITGKLNKQIAFELGTSEKTIKVHRGQVMRKMQAKSLPHLVRMAQVLGIGD